MYADQVQLYLLERLGYSHYMCGELDEAERYMRQVPAGFRELGTPLPNEGLEGVCELASECLGWIARWRQCPVQPERSRAFGVCDPGSDVDRGALFVRVHPLARVEASVASGGVSATVEAYTGTEYFARYRIVLQTEEPLPPGNSQTVVSVSSDAPFAGSASIPVSWQREGSIVVRPRSVFLGFVRGNELKRVDLAMTCRVPFHVQSVVCEAKWLRVRAEADPNGGNRTWRLHVETVPEQFGTLGPLQQQVRVHTDMPREEVIAVPCYMHVTG